MSECAVTKCVPVRRELRFPRGPILRTIDDLQEPCVGKEIAQHIDGARVVIANYRLIQHDFPTLRTKFLLNKFPDLSYLTESDRRSRVRNLIDAWLTDQAAFVSSSQAAQSTVNTPIRVDGRRITAYRPSGYGRALVISISESSDKNYDLRERCGLLDIKGAGVAPGRIPSHEEHSDGLEYLGVALSDFALQRIIDEIFRHAAPAFWTVPIYAILDLGFDISNGWRATAPAGMHVRRAHRRPLYGMDLPLSNSSTEAIKIEIEMLLRCYGLTSTATGTSFDISFEENSVRLLYNRQPVTGLNDEEIELLRRLRRFNEDQFRVEGINVQITRDVEAEDSRGQLLDFGHINLRERFKHPVASLVRDRILRIGGVIWPNDPAFIQPIPNLHLPLDKLGRMTLNDRCFRLADQFREKQLSTSLMAAEIDSIVLEGTEKWSHESEVVGTR